MKVLKEMKSLHTLRAKTGSIHMLSVITKLILILKIDIMDPVMQSTTLRNNSSFSKEEESCFISHRNYTHIYQILILRNVDIETCVNTYAISYHNVDYDIEDLHHGPSNAKHNPSQQLKFL
jgi:hypothetical protein